METPRLDKRTRQDLAAQMSRLAASYVPEWRFDEKNPDLGSGLALLFLDMFQESLREFNRIPEYAKREFFDILGAERRAPSPAQGFMTFDLVESHMPETTVQRGTLVIAEGADGSQVDFETEEDLYVTSAGVRETLFSREEWKICLTKPLESGLLHLLIIPDVQRAQSPYRLLWEYWGEKGWTSLEAEDGTEGFSKSGIVKFAGKGDYRSLELEGREGFWIRIREAAGLELLPEAKTVCLNAARVRAVRPGSEGNLPPKVQCRLGETEGFVSRVENPDVLYGGTGEETEAAAVKRRAAALKHRGRAVTPKDYERLAAEASGNVAKARCFPGYDGNGERCPGAVTVVLLQKNHLEERRYFYKVEEAVRAYLKERMGGGRLFVVPPLLVRIDVSARLRTERLNLVVQIKERALGLLDRYLNPVSGGADGGGFSMGRLPSHERIRRVLQETDQDVYIEKLYLTAWVEKDGRLEEASLEKLERFPWALPCSGEHRISINGGGF